MVSDPASLLKRVCVRPSALPLAGGESLAAADHGGGGRGRDALRSADRYIGIRALNTSYGDTSTFTLASFGPFLHLPGTTELGSVS